MFIVEMERRPLIYFTVTLFNKERPVLVSVGRNYSITSLSRYEINEKWKSDLSSIEFRSVERRDLNVFYIVIVTNVKLSI